MRLLRMAATIGLGAILVMLCAGMFSGASGHERVLSQAPAGINPKTPAVVTPPVSGTLHFMEVYTYSMSPYGSDSQAAADFDRDGRSDIVIAEVLRPTLTGRLALLYNLGSWQFAPTILITYPIAGSYLYQVKTADFNQDDWPDLVLRNHCEIHVLLNDQLGDFTTSWIGSDDYRYCGSDLAVGDMNGDKAPDIVAGEQSNPGGILDLFLNNGSGTFFTPTWQSPPLGAVYGGTFHDIVLGDLDNDSIPDIAASEIYNALLTTFSGDGTGLTFKQVMSEVVGNRTYGMVGGNLNGDALTDVVLNTDGVLHAFVAQGGAVFSETWTDPAVGNGVAQVLADFNHDGYDDLFASSFGAGHMYVYLNQPFSNTLQLAWTGQLPYYPVYDCTAADLNDDGNLDLVVGGESVLSIYRSIFLVERFYLPIVLRH